MWRVHATRSTSPKSSRGSQCPWPHPHTATPTCPRTRAICWLFRRKVRCHILNSSPIMERVVVALAVISANQCPAATSYFDVPLWCSWCIQNNPHKLSASSVLPTDSDGAILILPVCTMSWSQSMTITFRVLARSLQHKMQLFCSHGPIWYCVCYGLCSRYSSRPSIKSVLQTNSLSN